MIGYDLIAQRSAALRARLTRESTATLPGVSTPLLLPPPATIDANSRAVIRARPHPAAMRRCPPGAFVPGMQVTLLEDGEEQPALLEWSD